MFKNGYLLVEVSDLLTQGTVLLRQRSQVGIVTVEGVADKCHDDDYSHDQGSKHGEVAL